MSQLVAIPSHAIAELEKSTWVPQVGERVFITAVWSKHYGKQGVIVELSLLQEMALAKVRIPGNRTLWEAQYRWLSNATNPPLPMPKLPTIESPVAHEPDDVQEAYWDLRFIWCAEKLLHVLEQYGRGVCNRAVKYQTLAVKRDLKRWQAILKHQNRYPFLPKYTEKLPDAL